MKKTILSTLMAASVLNAASIGFAAENPFSDVPKDHWAYEAVAELSNDGIINGYGDDTFRGEKAITRYEMAQMVAKAMAKEADLNAQQKSTLAKLQSEFHDELQNLGVRVNELEKYSDKVKWTGLVEYTYTNENHDTMAAKTGIHTDGEDVSNEHGNLLTFRFEPTAEINDKWSAHARINADLDMDSDSTGDVSIERAWLEGDYNNFNIKLGRHANEINNFSFLDDPFTGATLTFGKDVKYRLAAGKVNLDTIADMNRYDDGRNNHVTGGDATTYYGAGIQYEKEGSKLSGGISYQGFKFDGDVITDVEGTSSFDATNHIFSVNARYAFDKNLAFLAEYAKSSLDCGEDEEAMEDSKKAYSFELQYKESTPDVVGSWGAFLGYRYLGQLACPASKYDDAMDGGQKGWELGFTYTPVKNTQIILKYFKGQDILAEQLHHDGDASTFFGRIDFSF